MTDKKWRRIVTKEYLSYHTCSVYKNSLVFYGGQSNMQSETNNLLEYDLVLNSFVNSIPKNDKIVARKNHQSEIIGNSLYLFCGIFVN
jgi:hypothetical protein